MRLSRYCIAGLLFNWLAFVFWFVVPIRATGFGASNTQLALLQTASTAFYVLNSIFIGKLSDRISRAFLARVAVAMAIVACALTVYIGSLNLLFFVVPIMGVAGSVFWPSIQGAVGAESGPDRLDRTIGWFNFSWSTGKTVGFVSAGWLIATYGHGLTLWLAVTAAVPVLLLYPRDKELRTDGAHSVDANHRTAFRTIGYISNLLGFAVGSIFVNLFFKYLKESQLVPNWDTRQFYGIFLGTIYLTQTLLFVVLQRGSGWTYRRDLVYGTQLLCAAAAVGLTFVRADAAILAAGSLIGISLGFSNASSIYYSLHGPADHGKYAGVHEAVVGMGTILGPLAGGAMADLTHDLRMPYWLVGAAMVVAIAAQEVVYRRRPSS
jgi:MFS family permease